ncbi:Mitochondrial 2-oxodicarboxylate carrier 2 [Phytophthora nicotianae]|uniref:Mitochondrial 2-oxodicarboxylate carrier 2 n=1 Tax=Phytophthora nicotianae TaxID=4792 RepID=A0A0W8DSQ1_PHYNI|nr:Mitochondrial 2-oxodicarboxylate carrier 2 [Phytophthora nicotianae]
MNGRFQEAAWVMHKSRVVAHRGTPDMTTETSEEEERRREVEMQFEVRRILPKRRRVGSTEEGEEEGVEVENREERQVDEPSACATLIHLPTTGWRCPGIVPDAFYRENVELVHAFAKYYVGTYRVNVVRDLRSDNVSADELSVLSKFKHSSDMNLNLEGRKLKQAAMAAVQHFCGSTARKGSGRTRAITARNERFDRVQQPLSMEVMLQLQSLDSSMHTTAAPEAMENQEGNMQQPSSPNAYLIQQNAAATEAIEQFPSSRDE